MQIMENVYIDIKVKGSNKRTKLNFDQLKDFQMVESAGTTLPYICFSFFTFDGDWAKQFVKNNTILLTIGRTIQDAETFTITMVDNQLDTDPSGNSWTVTGGGFIGNKEFITNKAMCKTYKGNSISTIGKIVRQFNQFKRQLNTNIASVNEKPMKWMQAHETASKFLMKTVLHMDIMPSFPLVTFDKYGTFYIRDYLKDRKEGYKWRFVHAKDSSADITNNTIQYINNFNVESYQTSYNMYSGYDRMSEIIKTEQGISSYIMNKNLPIIAATEESDTQGAGNRLSLNNIQSGNVHDTYMEAFAYNSNKLVALSSIQGVLELVGYHPELKPTDMVYVQTNKATSLDSNLEGLYIIDTIMFVPNFRNGTTLTYVYVTRDNWNNIEDSVTDQKKKKSLMKITKKAMEDLCNAISQTRTALAVCSQVLDGTFISYCLDFLVASKTNILRMFSLGGIGLDFNSQAFFIQSMLCVGNNIMNMLCNMLFPDFIASTLKDFLIDKPSMRRLLSNYIDQYVPSEIQNIISMLADALCNTQDKLNSIAKANNITARSIPEVATDIVPEVEEPANIVGEIITEFEGHTRGVDIPFPVITLTESQQLQSREEIKNYIADETISNLTDLGYMDGVDKDEFKATLMSNNPEVTLSFSTIDKLNRNAGNTYMYRYWGTYGPTNEALYAWSYKDFIVYTKTAEVTEYTRLFNNDYSPYLEEEFKVTKVDDKYKILYKGKDTERNELEDVNTTALAQLTSFYITKGFKDRYRTIPCTKLISATKNARLYFACPQSETGIKFYINSKRVNLDSFPIDLGFVDIYGNKLMYNVYYTTTGYNSNSTMLEIRQG